VLIVLTANGASGNVVDRQYRALAGVPLIGLTYRLARGWIFVKESKVDTDRRGIFRGAARHLCQLHPHSKESEFGHFASAASNVDTSQLFL
jgi:hypothetical protein